MPFLSNLRPRVERWVAAAFIGGYFVFSLHSIAVGLLKPAEASGTVQTLPVAADVKKTDGGCAWAKVGATEWRCSTPELDAKWKAWEESRKPKAKQVAYHKPFSPKHSKKQVEVAHKIVAIAKAEGVKDIPYLLALADCESSFGVSMRNAVGNTSAPGSVDRGYFMFNSRWHPDVTTKCADDLACATKAAIRKLKGGTHWVCQDIIEGEQKTKGRIDFYRKFASN